MRGWLVVACLVCGLAAGCGRLRYQNRQCPEGTAQMSDDGGLGFCIDIQQSRPDLTYVDATTYCNDRGMELCSDAQWYQACLAGVANDMLDDYEWVADLYSDTDAWKRGAGSCEGTATHTINTDPYGVRCCGGL